MQSLIFAPATQAILGALGVNVALWSLQRRREGKPMHPDAARSDKWLLLFGGLMVAIGLYRWLAETGSAVGGAGGG
jgi:hypothetical protein